MQSKASTVTEYISELPEDRKAAIIKLRKEIKKNLPKGFKEVMSYGMIGYVVPHSLFPPGYHCNPDQPLPFMNLASQKNFITIHHMGVYGNKELLNWFVREFPKHSTGKLDMGKGCIRFKNPDEIPYALIGKLSSRVTPKQWMEWYEKVLNQRKK